MFKTAPVPASTKFNLADREIKTRWILNPEAEGVPQVVVDLTTSHWGSSKQYSTTLTWGTVEERVKHPADGPGSYSMYSWASDHRSVRVHSAPVARYSAKTLEAHHEIALAVVSDYWENGPVTVFEEAAERNGLGEFAEEEV